MKSAVKKRGDRYFSRLALAAKAALLSLSISLVSSSLSLTALAQTNTQKIAQLSPDLTLGDEQSTVTESSDRVRLGGGAVRGSALFHSFLDFNVDAGQQVYFVNPESITNILTRVTGTQISNISGTLGVEGSANLFLMNPNGITFGENAHLDIAGSFTATTADRLWVDDDEFSTVRPEISPLLTVSVSPGLQYGTSQSESVIENKGRLAVSEEQQIVFRGGTVRQTGNIVAPAGLVELSGEVVELTGAVDTRSPDGTAGILLIDPKNILIQAGEPLNSDSIGIALATNNVELQADNDITIDDDIGSITENNLTLSAGRSLTIDPNRSVLLNGGDFTARINAQPVNPSDRDPGIATFSMGLESQIVTNGGTASITSGSFANTSQIDTANAEILTGSRMGDGGAITLSALGDVSTGLLDSRSAVGIGGDIEVRSDAGAIATSNDTLADGTLQAGDISFSAGDSIAVNGLVTASSFGPAGDVTITAKGDIDLRSPRPVNRLGDIDSSGSLSGQISITSGGEITTDDLRIANRISGDGVGKDIRFSAEAIEFNRTSITSRTRDESQGATLGFEQDAVSGNVIIDVASDLTLKNTNIFTSADFGSGDAGNVTIDAQRLQILTSPDFVFPFGSAFGIFAYGDVESTGDGGNIDINASDFVEIVGISPGEFVPSTDQAEAQAVITELVTAGTSIFAPAFGGGKAGNIQLRTERLSIRDGAGLITTAVFDEGGDISVVADEIDLQGFALIATGTGITGENAGNLDIQAGRVDLTGGAVISASSFGAGDSGDLSLTAQQLRIQDGSSISAAAFDAGDGGILTIQADDLIKVSGASDDGSFASSIASNSLGSGDAGPLTITTDNLVVSDRAAILTSTLGSGAGADIEIDTGTLQINDAQINASTATADSGGDIQIRARDSVEIVGSGFNDLTQNIIEPSFDGTLDPANLNQGIVTVTTGDGNAGSVQIETPHFTARNGALISTSTLGSGSGGNINIVAEEDLILNSTLLATGTFTEASSGDIRLQTKRLRASGGAQAITTTFGSGTAGNLTAIASESIDLIDPTETGIASGLFASSFQTAAGTGGDIRVETGDFRIVDGATVSVSGEGAGDAGNIDVGARSLFLDEGSITATSASGEGGNIVLRITDALTLRNNSEISTTAGQAGSSGNGGNITFRNGFIIAVPDENSDITANAFEGRGGNISIESRGLLGIDFRDRLTPASDITASSEIGLDGKVNIELTDPAFSSTPPELPAQTEPDNQVAARCAAPANEANSLVVTGRGGLPTDPRQTLQGETILQDVRISNLSAATVPSPPVAREVSQPAVVEAQGWNVDGQGQVRLVTASATPSHTAINCSTTSESLN